MGKGLKGETRPEEEEEIVEEEEEMGTSDLMGDTPPGDTGPSLMGDNPPDDITEGCKTRSTLGWGHGRWRE